MKNLLILFFLIFFGTQAFGHVDLIAPQGGETFTVGEVVLIQWQETIPHDTQNWDLFISTDGGQTWETLLADIDHSVSSYNWTVPNIITTQGRIQIVQDNTGMDYTDASEDFTILDNTTAVNESTVEPISIFPNPTANNLTIHGHSQARIELYNMAGLLLQSKESTDFDEQFDLTAYPVGVYYFNIITPEENRTFKVVRN